MSFTLKKAERLSKKKIIEKMFQGGVSHSFSIFPLRVVYLSAEGQEMPLSMMISVSKRHFKRAVKRNRVKRIIRETWRLHKGPLQERLVAQHLHIAVALIYLSDRLPEFVQAEKTMKIIVQRLMECYPNPAENETIV